VTFKLNAIEILFRGNVSYGSWERLPLFAIKYEYLMLPFPRHGKTLEIVLGNVVVASGNHALEGAMVVMDLKEWAVA
jgi:hypothetical protein